MALDVETWALLKRREIWFNALTSAQRKQFDIDYRAGTRTYPDELKIGLGLGGGCKRPEDSGFASAHCSSMEFADCVLGDSQGGIIASNLGNYGVGLPIWESLAGTRFDTLESGESTRAGLKNLFRICAYTLVQHPKTQAALETKLAKQFAVTEKIKSMPPPLDMDYLKDVLDRYGSDAYQNMRPDLIILTTRMSDGKLVGFKINHRPQDEMRQIVMACCRLLGPGGKPVSLPFKPEFVVGDDGALEKDIPPPLPNETYADTVYSGHPIRMAKALECSHFGMYCNRDPKNMKNFDTIGTHWLLMGFLYYFSPAAYKKYPAVTAQTNAALIEAADTGSYGSMRTSLLNWGDALTSALEKNWGKLQGAFMEGHQRGEDVMELASQAAAKLPPLALPHGRVYRAIHGLAARFPERPLAALLGLGRPAASTALAANAA